MPQPTITVNSGFGNIHAALYISTNLSLIMPLRTPRSVKIAGLAAMLISHSSCYTYRVATHAQASTDQLTTTTKHAYSLFWGLMNKPQVVMTPNCDDLGVGGISELTVKTNFGYALVTVATLGIYCPVIVSWKCAKPCNPTETL